MKDLKTIKLMWSQLMYILNKKQKRNMFFVFITILIGACLETLGVSSILPFVQMLTMPDVMMEKPYIQIITKFFGISNSMQVTLLVGAALIAIFIIKNLGLVLSGYIQVRYSVGLVKEISIQMMKSYLNHPYSFFVDTPTGEIMRGVTNDGTAIQAIILNIFKLASEILIFIVIAFYIIFKEPVMALAIIVICGACFLGILIVLKKKISRLGIITRNVWAELSQLTLQTVYGIKDIFVKQKKQVFLSRYTELEEKTRAANTSYNFVSLLPERIIETTCIGGIIAVVLVSIAQGASSSEFLPILALFAVAAFRMLPSISRITGYVATFIYQRPALATAYENIKEAREYMDGLVSANKDKENPKNEIHFQESIQIKDIVWQYNEKNGNVLNGLSLDIKKGESIGIIGESGSGKSTLSDILLGLYIPQKGSVTMDGYSIFEIPDSWSKIMGYVPQTVFLLDDTIRNNVAFGEEQIDDGAVWHALEQASLKKFVETLPEGLDTIVGERGLKFSGGQRQRIAIARALYGKPDILILDEATSALDNETETAVMEAIEALQGSMTMIIIAHRLTTIKNCDRVIKIENGKAIPITKEEVLELSRM